MSNTFGNVCIIGDSYSTFKDCIPKGNACCYPRVYDDGTVQIDKVEKTWWHQFISQTGSNLVLNDSWSGSTVCKTGYSGVVSDDSPFYKRAEKYLKDGKYNGQKIDTLFVFGGTNDNWANAPLGDYKYENWTETDFESFLPAFCYLCSYLKKEMPDVRIVSIVNTELKDEVSKGIAEISNHFGIEWVELKNINKIDGHPDELGMTQIKDQILEKIN